MFNFCIADITKVLKVFGSLCFAMFFSFLAASQTKQAQNKQGDNDYLIVDSIRIAGNERTKRYIILREMTFAQGDTLKASKISPTIEQNENNVMKTQLFVTVQMDTMQLYEDQVAWLVKVKERWYTFPAPIFNLADRNFNEWWVEYDHQLSRTEYGIRFFQENLTGRNDQLKTLLQFGYTKKFKLSYTLPFFDAAQKSGLKVGAAYNQNREIAVKTDSNKLEFFDGDGIMKKGVDFQLQYRRREAIHNTHFAEVKFFSNWVDRSVLSENNRYYKQGENIQRYFQLRYKYQSDFLNNSSYPLKGYFAELDLSKLGLGIFNDVDIWQAKANYDRFTELTKDFYLANSVKGKYSYPRQQPFSIEEGLGYGSRFVRGYEYYVINGQDYLLNRNTLKFQFLEHTFENLDFIPIEQFRTIPITLLFKVYGDHGYVWDYTSRENNLFGNQHIYGYGAGFDFVTFYDSVFRFEYSFNERGESDLFLHFSKAF